MCRSNGLVRSGFDDAMKHGRKTGFTRRMESAIWSHNTRNERAARRGVEENFTPYQRQAILMQFNKSCFLCGNTVKLNIDHHRPLSFGNALDYGNAVVLCSVCNTDKGNKPPEDFYTSRELIKLEALLDVQRQWTLR